MWLLSLWAQCLFYLGTVDTVGPVVPVPVVPPPAPSPSGPSSRIGSNVPFAASLPYPIVPLRRGLSRYSSQLELGQLQLLLGLGLQLCCPLRWLQFVRAAPLGPEACPGCSPPPPLARPEWPLLWPLSRRHSSSAPQGYSPHPSRLVSTARTACLLGCPKRAVAAASPFHRFAASSCWGPSFHGGLFQPPRRSPCLSWYLVLGLCASTLVV